MTFGLSQVYNGYMNVVRGRYAPSPTGTLHMGNLRTALLAWLSARVQGSQFVMRVEDLDTPRVRAVGPETARHMLDDLHWLGLDWDEGPDIGGLYAPYVQSERLDIYHTYLQKLQGAGQVYPCYCTRSEIAHAASIASAPQQGADDAPRYPGTCRTLTETQRRAYEASGRRPSMRFRVDDERVVTFTDLLAGPITQHVQQLVDDFILYRSDGIFAYQFAVVVDDALMHINQVVRGLDLLSSTPRQILLYEALGLPIPTFAHVPLMLDSDGRRLAKRSQSMGLDPLRAAGMTPQQVVGQLAASCGLVRQGEEISAKELVRRYSGVGYVIMLSKLAKSLMGIDK
jgi:glutamyl-tRNA synthetase